MTASGRLAVASLALLLSACIYVPVVDRHEAGADTCKTLTQSMSLETIEMQSNITYGCTHGECLAAALATAAVVSTGSAIISGSIVLTGNTIHWLEYQGTCSDGYLNRAKQLFLDSLSKLNLPCQRRTEAPLTQVSVRPNTVPPPMPATTPPRYPADS